MTVSWSSALRPNTKPLAGIIIPDTAKEKPSQGEVTAVGPGGRDEAGKLIPIDVQVGDRVSGERESCLGESGEGLV